MLPEAVAQVLVVSMAMVVVVAILVVAATKLTRTTGTNVTSRGVRTPMSLGAAKVLGHDLATPNNADTTTAIVVRVCGMLISGHAFAMHDHTSSCDVARVARREDAAIHRLEEAGIRRIPETEIQKSASMPLTAERGNSSPHRASPPPLPSPA